MQLTATQDIAADPGEVWAHATDFDAFERRMAASAEDVTRVPEGPAREGTRWAGDAEILGKRRLVAARIERLSPRERVAVAAEADGIEVALDAELEPLAGGRTRLTVTLEARSRSLGGKVLLSSLSLGRGKLEERFRGRVAAFAARVEGA
jgi:uncharacterized protein YndB with AHSA1/START domain